MKAALATHTPYVVFRDQGQWNIKSNNVHYGPYATQRDAIRAAVDAAHEAGRKGLTAKSCFRINSESSGPTEKTRIRRTAQTISSPMQTLRSGGVKPRKKFGADHPRRLPRASFLCAWRNGQCYRRWSSFKFIVGFS